MFKYRRIIEGSARRIAAAANRAVGDYVADDPNLTGVMLARMKQVMDGYKTRGVRWTAKTITNKTGNAPENANGPDFLGIVEFDLSECRIKKVFLAQSLRIESGQKITPAEWNHLADQCREMLSITAESFVFIYARSGIIVVPALAIVSASAPANPHRMYSRTALRFYQDHFECFVGDPRLASADAPELERLNARHALCLTASQIQPLDLQLKLGPIS